MPPPQTDAERITGALRAALHQPPSRTAPPIR
jgi:hypothetical protein